VEILQIQNNVWQYTVNNITKKPLCRNELILPSYYMFVTTLITMHLFLLDKHRLAFPLVYR